MEVRVKRSSSYIQHADRKDHKYVAKVKLKNGKYRYFYDKGEYNRYLLGKKIGNAFNNLKKKAEKLDDKIDKKLDKLKAKVKAKSKVDNVLKKKGDASLKGFTLLINNKTLGQAIKFVKDKLGIDKKITSEEKVGHKYIAKVKTANGSYRYFYDQDEYNAYLRRQDYQKDEPQFMKRIPDMEDGEIYAAEDDVSEINEKYDPYDPRYSMNCMYCTAAYELRRRGYDVEAAARGDEYTGDLWELSKWYKEPEVYHVNASGAARDMSHLVNADNSDSYQTYYENYGTYSGQYSSSTIVKAIEKNNPPNSRGELGVYWNGGGGHSLIYETDHSGKVTIRDAQTNSVVSPDYLAANVRSVEFCRTDNLELNEGILETIENN